MNRVGFKQQVVEREFEKHGIKGADINSTSMNPLARVQMKPVRVLQSKRFMPTMIEPSGVMASG